VAAWAANPKQKATAVWAVLWGCERDIFIA
jgi:hypothetical protein